MADAAKRRRRAVPRSSTAESDGLDLGSDKLYFKIGEVAEIVGVPAYVLRYWESEFPAVRPQKSRTQQRVYRRRDVATLLKIKHLLYEQRFTIAGARAQLKDSPETVGMAAPSQGFLARQSLQRALGLLAEVRALVRAEEPIERAAADPSQYLGQRALGSRPRRSAHGAEAVPDADEDIEATPATRTSTTRAT